MVKLRAEGKEAIKEALKRVVEAGEGWVVFEEVPEDDVEKSYWEAEIIDIVEELFPEWTRETEFNEETCCSWFNPERTIRIAFENNGYPEPRLYVMKVDEAYMERFYPHLL